MLFPFPSAIIMFEPTSVPRIKCGQIYIMPNDIFALMCKFCEYEFHDLNEFREHLTEHFPDKPVNIKNEDSVSLGSEPTSECELTLSEMHDEMDRKDFHIQEDTASKSPVLAEDLPPSFSPSLLTLDKEPIKSKPSSSRIQRRRQPKRQCKLYQSINETEKLQISSPNGQKIGGHYMFRKRVQRSDAIDLTIENKKSSNSRQKHHVCRLCYKSFRDKRALLDHENTHYGNRPYQCTVCSKDYANGTSLNKSGKCRFGACSETPLSSSLTLHGNNKVHKDDRRHTSENLPPVNDSPRHKCQYCHRTFALVGNRGRHELMCSENRSVMKTRRSKNYT